MTVEEAIQKHGAMKVLKAAREVDRGNNYDPLRNLGLTIESSSDVSHIDFTAFLALQEEESLQIRWESHQRFLKRMRREVLASSRDQKMLAQIDREIAMSPEELDAEINRSKRKVWMCGGGGSKKQGKTHQIIWTLSVAAKIANMADHRHVKDAK
jgi:hypothetical protein